MKNHSKFAVLATDVAALTTDGNELKILITPASSTNFRGIPALPGGLIKPSETAQEAAERILSFSLSVANVYSEQLYTFDSPERDPAGRVVSIAYLVLLPWNKARTGLKDGARWLSVKNLPNLAYDHNEIVKTAVKRLRGKITYTNIVFTLMPKEFTLPELQNVYETILDKKLDKRNFRKKIHLTGLVKSIGKLKRGEANRPAKLYSFKEASLQHIDIL